MKMAISYFYIFITTIIYNPNISYIKKYILEEKIDRKGVKEG